MWTHEEGECTGRACCIHNPSNHHMTEWPQNWREDSGFMERICPCGTGHPDPDDLVYRQSFASDEKSKEIMGIHGCCGHCWAEEE